MGTSTENVRVVISAKDKASGVLKKLKGTIIAAAAGFAAFQLGKKIMTDIIQKTLETERIYNKLSQALEHHGYQWKLVEASVRSFTGAMQTATGMSDELIAEGLQKLVSYGMTVPAAMDAMKSSMDLAVGGGMDLKAAIDLIGKASVGYTSTLSRYGIILDETIPKEEKFALALEKINEMFGGAAQAQMETTIGQLNRLSETWGDLLEIVGKSETGFISTFASNTANALQIMNDAMTSSVGFWDLAVADLYLLFGNASKQFDNQMTRALEWVKAQEDLAAAGVEAEAGSVAATVAALATKRAAINAYFDETFTIHESTAFMEAEQLAWIEEHKSSMVELTAEEKMAAIQFEMNQDLMATAADASNKAIEKTTQRRVKKVGKFLSAAAKAERDSIAAIARERDRTMREYGYETARFASSAISSFGKTRKEAAEIWKQMAKDFAAFFIKKALLALMGPGGFAFEFVSALKFFDVAANDRMAMKMGQDYAMFFTQGVNQGMADFTGGFAANLGGSPSLNAANGPASETIINNIYISGGVDESMIRNVLAPILSDLSANNYTGISFDPQIITSEAAVELA